MFNVHEKHFSILLKYLLEVFYFSSGYVELCTLFIDIVSFEVYERTFTRTYCVYDMVYEKY